MDLVRSNSRNEITISLEEYNTLKEENKLQKRTIGMQNLRLNELQEKIEKLERLLYSTDKYMKPRTNMNSILQKFQKNGKENEVFEAEERVDFGNDGRRVVVEKELRGGNGVENKVVLNEFKEKQVQPRENEIKINVDRSFDVGEGSSDGKSPDGDDKKEVEHFQYINEKYNTPIIFNSDYQRKFSKGSSYTPSMSFDNSNDVTSEDDDDESMDDEGGLNFLKTQQSVYSMIN